MNTKIKYDELSYNLKREELQKEERFFKEYDLVVPDWKYKSSRKQVKPEKK